MLQNNEWIVMKQHPCLISWKRTIFCFADYVFDGGKDEKMKYLYSVQIIDMICQITSEFPIARIEKNKGFLQECKRLDKKPNWNFHVICDYFEIPKEAKKFGSNGDKNLYYREEIYYRELIRIMNGRNIRAVTVYSRQVTGAAGTIYIDGRIQTALGSELNILDFLPLEQMLLEKEALILHASHIIWQGKSILFTGPSGIGKSSQAELWRQYLQAEIVNGDRAIIKRSSDAGQFYAYGCPYSGSSPYCKNNKAEITAVILLEQAPYNQIKPVTAGEAYAKIFSQITVNLVEPENVQKAMAIVEQWIQEIPVYRLLCRLDREAAELVRSVLRLE